MSRRRSLGSSPEGMQLHSVITQRMRYWWYTAQRCGIALAMGGLLVIRKTAIVTAPPVCPTGQRYTWGILPTPHLILNNGTTIIQHQGSSPWLLSATLCHFPLLRRSTSLKHSGQRPQRDACLLMYSDKGNKFKFQAFHVRYQRKKTSQSSGTTSSRVLQWPPYLAWTVSPT